MTRPQPLGSNWAPVLAVVLLTLLAVTPLLQADMPCTHDGGLHYYRVVALRHAVANGLLYSRYVPDLAFGYGYPFFNYREPVPYYLTLALYLLGLPLPVALNAIYVLGILGSALGAYLLARDLFGPLGGVVAAVAYAYAPYQFLDALLRGNAPESLALSLLPFILWAFRRLVLGGRCRDVALGMALLAVLILTHNISTLLFVPVLVLYLALLVGVYGRRSRPLWVVMALLGAFGLTAFFWMPALFEQQYVQLHMSRVTRNNDFHYNFVELGEIFAPPTPVDTSLLNPPMRVSIGLGLVGFGVLGWLVGNVRVRDLERRATLSFLFVIAAVMIWLCTESSMWVWENMPLLPFVQFPWRLVGRVSLPLALLSGALFVPSVCSNAEVNRGRFVQLPNTVVVKYMLFFICVSALILLALPSLYPPHGYCKSTPYPTIEGVFRYERESGLVGVDPEGSYFPVWVEERPNASLLEGQYAAGEPVRRFDETALPAGAVVISADYGPNRARIELETPKEFHARYLVFYFPGWRVWMDGRSVPVSPSKPEGLLTFTVPTGRHVVDVRFTETPLRLVADGISLATLVAIGVGLLLARRPAVCTCPLQTERAKVSLPNEDGFKYRGVLLAGAFAVTICTLGLKLGLVDRTATIFRRPSLREGGHLPAVQQHLDRRFADGLRLLGFRLSSERLPADGLLRVDLYWTAYARPKGRYQTVVHLVGADRLRWSRPDSFRPRGYADYPSTDMWDTSHYALDSHEVQPLDGTPPGRYTVVLTVFERDTLRPLSVLNDEGQPVAPELILSEVELIRPRRPVPLPAENRLDRELGGITLVSVHFDRQEATAGESVFIRAYWRFDPAKASTDVCVPMWVLVAEDGTVGAQYPVALPNLEREPGDVWLSQQQVVVPAVLAPGSYVWRVQCGARCVSIGRITVSVPRRIYQAPSFQFPVQVRFDEIATLVGYDLSASSVRTGDTLTVTLIWRVEGIAEESYHVFLHLRNAAGLVVTQSDGVPDGWTRPTTGWVPGEYIVDQRLLPVPNDLEPGEYVLSTGLYLPSGGRLHTMDGRDAVELSRISVRES